MLPRRAVLGGLVASGLGAALAPFDPAFARDMLRVRVRQGLLRGRMEGGVRVFTGIPYGHAARFGRPVPARDWADERDATQPARAAPQPQDAGAIQAEDCLQLNVWAPAAPPPPHTRYPVLVYIHGGSNETGWSGAAMTAGDRFAAHGVVCVTLNYRLGALGFLELGGILGPAYAGSGNNALRDIILGLQWVRDNIAAFGGNPHAVTVAGESAGGKNVGTLLGLPAADGLYARAMVFSGGAQTINLPGDAQTFAEAVTRRLGGRERLLVAPFPAIVAAQAAVRRAWPRGLPFRPTLDGRFMPMVPLFRVARGQAPRVPLLIGSNADESRLFLTETQAARPLNSQSVANETMARMAALDQAYARAFPDLSGAERHWKLLTAEEYMMPGLRLARTHAAHGNPVWRYRMDLPAPGGPNKGSTPHVLDVPLTFDHVTLPIAGQMFGFSAAQQPMADAWHGAVLAFVRGGAPGSPGLPLWPRFEPSNHATMVVDRVSMVVDDPDSTERMLWGEPALVPLPQQIARSGNRLLG